VRLLSSRRSAIALVAVLAAGAIASSRSVAGAGAIRGARSQAHDDGSTRSGEEAITAANHSGGGLSVSPGIFEQLARRGRLGVVQISNTTSSSMAISVALRPWLQSRGGEVSPNRRTTLGEVGVGPRSFTLGAGATRAVSLSLSRTPSQRSLYGALEVTALPRGRVSHGLRVAYRVVSSLRLDPPKNAQSFRAQAGGLVEQGSARHGTLLLAVRNTGNTIVPIGGTALISGPGRSLRATAGTKTIVPGQTVNVPLTELLGSLPAGHYTVTVHLSQGGRGIGTITRKIGLR
jgi:hypothetical protein